MQINLACFRLRPRKESDNLQIIQQIILKIGICAFVKKLPSCLNCLTLHLSVLGIVTILESTNLDKFVLNVLYCRLKVLIFWKKFDKLVQSDWLRVLRIVLKHRFLCLKRNYSTFHIII